MPLASWCLLSFLLPFLFHQHLSCLEATTASLTSCHSWETANYRQQDRQNCRQHTNSSLLSEDTILLSMCMYKKMTSREDIFPDNMMTISSREESFMSQEEHEDDDDLMLRKSSTRGGSSCRCQEDAPVLGENDDVMSHDLCNLRHHQQQHENCLSFQSPHSQSRISSRRSPSTRRRRRSTMISSLLIVMLSFLISDMLPPSLSSSLILPLTSASSITQAERRLSSRIVTTKYGALRGYLVSLPNRSLQPVEVFMGELISF